MSVEIKQVGERFITRDGRTVEIIDKDGSDKEYPWLAQYADELDKTDWYRPNGMFSAEVTSKRDLVDKVELEYERGATDKATQPSRNVSAPELLYKAAEIMAERGKTYDSEGGERSMGKAVSAFNTITSRGITESEGWLLLQLLKDVRQWSREGYHADSAEDCIAYAALKAEALARGES